MADKILDQLDDMGLELKEADAKSNPIDVMEAINILQDKLDLSTPKVAIERAFNIALALADEGNEAGRVLLISGDGSCVQLQIKGEAK